SHLLLWALAVGSEPRKIAASDRVPAKSRTVVESILVPVALLVAAGGLQPEELLRARAQAHLGTQLSADNIQDALEELDRQGLVEQKGTGQTKSAALTSFLERRGLHPYVRELADLLASEE